MLKVNEEKLLHDYHILDAKRADNLAVIEADAKAFAAAHGYDEKTTDEFITFTAKAGGYGLTAEEGAKLELLLSYIDIVDEPVEEVKAEDIPECAASAVINNI